MTLPTRDHTYLPPTTLDQVAAMVLELAAQLHVERQRRMALEALLRRQGTIPDPESLAADPALLDAARRALDTSLHGLLRIMTETGTPAGPLRAEAL